MKNYTVTVNGRAYEVTVEETNNTAKSVNKTIVKSVPEKKVASAGMVGSVNITAGASGKVFKIEASKGQYVEKGAPIIIIEAMKMEIPVVAPQAGTVASIKVAVGDTLEAGEILATLN